jgi:glycosyltransferase involved in cell wall biosynthesis
VTAGTDRISGGHRYHQRLLAAAPSAGFSMRVVDPSVRLRLPATDVVVVDSLYAWTVSAAVRRRRRPPVVAVAHQHPGGSDGSRWAAAVRARLDIATYRACDLLVTPGPLLADVLTAEHGLDPRRITVIEPGCDLPSGPVVPPLRGRRRSGLLHVANWLPNKGVLELLEAVAALPDDDVTLHLVGRMDVAPEYTAQVMARIERPDLAERVVVSGALDAVAVSSLYAAADAFAFPSRVETYGSAAAEALAAGLPVVGWRTPHLLHLVDEGVEGVLVAPGDVEALAAAIHHLAVDDVDRGRLASAARLRGARLPTWSETTARFFAALARLVTEAVEPTHDPFPVDHVDPADAGVLDEQPIGGDGRRRAERPADGGLDRTDVGDHDHH